MQILFATYRTFTNTQLLIETILNRYQDDRRCSTENIAVKYVHTKNIFYIFAYVHI